MTVDAAQGVGTRGEVAGEAGYQPLLAVAHCAILSTDTEGEAFAAEFGALLQAAPDAQAADGATPPVTPPMQDALIARSGTSAARRCRAAGAGWLGRALEGCCGVQHRV